MITKFEVLVPEGIISLSYFVFFELLIGLFPSNSLFGKTCCLEILLIASRIQDNRSGLERSLLGFFCKQEKSFEPILIAAFYLLTICSSVTQALITNVPSVLWNS